MAGESGTAGTPEVIIIGGGFGGLAAARALAKAPCRITLVDRRNHHLFQPLLYQVATAGLAAPDIAAPIRQLLRKQRNARVLLGEVAQVDVAGRAVVLVDGARLPYDHLIVAAGATHSYFGHDEWAAWAPGLKTLNDALTIRRRVLLSFEQAERSADAAERRALLTFVVVGGGPTGVELAGSVAEIAFHTLRQNFRAIDPADARVVLVEGGPRVLATFSEETSAVAAKSLGSLKVEVRCGVQVTRIDEGGLDLSVKATNAGEPNTTERLVARTVLWGAGVRGVPLGASLGAPVDRGGRVTVGPELSLAGHPEVAVIGDLARVAWPGRPEGVTVPGVAPAAIQMGRLVAENLKRRWAGQPTRPFAYKDKGSMATIGRKLAVAELGKLRLKGFVAWLAWLLVHLMSLVGFRNRWVVLTEWGWAYFTRERSARVVLEGPHGTVEWGTAAPPSVPRVTTQIPRALPASAAPPAAGATGEQSAVEADAPATAPASATPSSSTSG